MLPLSVSLCVCVCVSVHVHRREEKASVINRGGKPKRGTGDLDSERQDRE